jgi:hypothetical protein
VLPSLNDELGHRYGLNDDRDELDVDIQRRLDLAENLRQQSDVFSEDRSGIL